MLILSRRESESIHLGDDIILTIVRVSGEKVRIGVQAPPHIKVLREELSLAEEKLNAEAVLVETEACLVTGCEIAATGIHNEAVSVERTQLPAKPVAEKRKPGPLARRRAA